MAWDVVKKIQAMVAKAESTPSLDEAETIMTMVRKMLDQHGISLLTIRNTVMSDDPVEVQEDVYGFWASDNWMKKLSDAAAHYYGVRIVWQKQGNYTHITVVGRESCRAAYAAMLPYLRLRVRRMAASGWRHGNYQSESRARTQIGIALAYRLYALVLAEQNRPRQATEAAGLNMLVPVDEMEQVLKEHFPGIKEAKLISKARPTRQAIEDASKINLGDQLNAEDFQRRIAG